jgi:hypothetical protein
VKIASQFRAQSARFDFVEFKLNNLQGGARFPTGGKVREPGCMGWRFGESRTASLKRLNR